jgi:hypothetical protein
MLPLAESDSAPPGMASHGARTVLRPTGVGSMRAPSNAKDLSASFSAQMYKRGPAGLFQ